MILAWVMSLLLLCSTLIVHLERLAALRVIEVKTMESAHKNFMAAEMAISECEEHISNLSALINNNCYIEPAGKNIWKITSKEKPSIQIHIHVDQNSGVSTRLNWRQVFE